MKTFYPTDKDYQEFEDYIVEEKTGYTITCTECPVCKSDKPCVCRPLITSPMTYPVVPQLIKHQWIDPYQNWWNGDYETWYETRVTF